MEKTETFAEWITRVRTAKGLRQAEAARQMGIPRSRLCEFETGERRPNYLAVKAIAKVYALDEDYTAARAGALSPAAQKAIRTDLHVAEVVNLLARLPLAVRQTVAANVRRKLAA